MRQIDVVREHAASRLRPTLVESSMNTEGSTLTPVGALRSLEYSGVSVLVVLLLEAPLGGMTVGPILASSGLCAETVYGAPNRMRRLGLASVTAMPGRVRPSKFYQLTKMGRQVGHLLRAISRLMSETDPGSGIADI